jgi:putative acetyltransferase
VEGGITPLKDEANILEIQKLYFFPEIRQQGLAKKILELACEFAQTHHIDSL